VNIGLLIDGQDVQASGGATFRRRDPVTDSVATQAPAARAPDAEAAIRSSERAFAHWSRTGPAERRALLLKAADLMESKADAFTRLMLEETGATAPWAGFNAMLAAGMLREAAAITTQIAGEVIPSNKPGALALTMLQPRGVCVGIAPWNAPVILGTRAVAMPIACGNTVVLKASELCPATHRLIGQVFAEAGFPNGVLNVLTNDSKDAAEVVETLIAHPAVRHVNFTGSTRVGRVIAKLAAEHLKPVLLELGGKAPLLVLHDADIDAAVNAAIFGAFMHQGQICMSTERIIVDRSIADIRADQAEQEAEHDHAECLQQRAVRDHDGRHQAEHHQREVLGGAELQRQAGQRRGEERDQEGSDCAGEERAERRGCQRQSRLSLRAS
jgi:acyl-CoA reductase-like NAD-dependent aldehyde dehydrogenase